ncbi:unnamed protein product [Ilex paraguariensis]|uniref:Uncharacterized protein n=1 Tax=Ilex paraguariensis TaxID=185542 RepID=A0ABC8R5Q1_9AQUA
MSFLGINKNDEVLNEEEMLQTLFGGELARKPPRSRPTPCGHAPPPRGRSPPPPPCCPPPPHPPAPSPHRTPPSPRVGFENNMALSKEYEEEVTLSKEYEELTLLENGASFSTN